MWISRNRIKSQAWWQVLAIPAKVRLEVEAGGSLELFGSLASPIWQSSRLMGDLDLKKKKRCQKNDT